MNGVVVLVALIGGWVIAVNVLKRRGWSGFRRHLAGGSCGFVAVMLVGGLMSDPDEKRGGEAKAVEATPANVKEPEVESPERRREQSDARIRKLSRDIVAIKHLDEAKPPKLSMTLKVSGWDEASAFHSFAASAASILSKAGTEPLAEEGADILFVLQTEVVTTDGDGATKKSDAPVMALLVSSADVPAIIADKERPPASALLRQSKPLFNSRIGKEAAQAFCDSSRFQGPSGIAPSSTFCKKFTR